MSFTPFLPEDVLSRQAMNEKLSGLAAGEVPAGGIIAWSGSVDAIPQGWRLCDGTGGTPDLRGRFILGAGGSYAVGAAGGEEKHTLSTSEMPRHRHSLLGYFRSSSGTPIQPQYAKKDGDTETMYTDYAGSSQPHNNMPPYYALCYIMKL